MAWLVWRNRHSRQFLLLLSSAGVLIVFRDIRCIKYRLPRSSVRATRAGSPVTEIRVSSRAQTFRAAVSRVPRRSPAWRGRRLARLVGNEKVNRTNGHLVLAVRHSAARRGKI
jgi:hypothetical protein